MSLKLQTFFKVQKGVKPMSFGVKAPSNFNYVDFDDPTGRFLNNTAGMFKQMNDSYMVSLSQDPSDGKDFIHGLKLTNQSILTWEDYWIDSESKKLIDPRIHHLNLQKNELIHANFNTSKMELRSLNLEGNLGLQALFIRRAPKLELVNISNCPSLEVINLGENRAIKALLARNCNLSPLTQERLLRDFTPVSTSSSNVRFNMFRKNYETLLDMRGTQIDWSNRRIASKIRLLLCNNWLVLWDNPPPVSIVPPHMYAFFTSSLEDSLIKDYYSSQL